MHVLDKQLSRSLCFNFTHCVQKKNLFLVWLPGILANSNENYIRYNSQALLIFPENFRKFPKILNFRKICNPSYAYEQPSSCKRSNGIVFWKFRYVIKHTSVAIASTYCTSHGEMARLSWPVWLVKYPGGLPADGSHFSTGWAWFRWCDQPDTKPEQSASNRQQTWRLAHILIEFRGY